MSTIALPGLTSDEAKRLQQAGICSASDLFASVGALPALSTSTGIPCPRLSEVLATAADHASARVARPPWRHIWGMVRHATLASVVAFTGLVVWAAASGVAAAIGGASHSTMLIVGPGGLQPFEAIELDDLISVQRRPVNGAFSSKEDLVGRYPIEAIAPGMVIVPGLVSGRRLPVHALDGRVVMSVPLNAAPLAPPTLPQIATLYTSARVTGAAGPVIVPQVLVLKVRRDGTAASATLALLPEAAATLNSVLGTSTITLAFPSPTAAMQ